MSEQTGVEMGKLSGPEEQNKRDHIQNNKKQQRTTKNNKKQQKTTTTSKNRNHNINTTETNKHQPQSQSKSHRNNTKHPKTTAFTCFGRKKGTFSDLVKQQEELWRCRFHPQGRCLAPRQLPNFGGCTPIKTLHLPETDPFSGLLLVGPFTAVIDLEKK